MATRYPNARLTGVDPASAMLNVARERLSHGHQLDRIELVAGLVENLPNDTDFDAAMAILVMHFLPDDGAKLALLNDIATRLQPGAPLVIVDACGDVESTAFERLCETWHECLVTAGLESSDATEGLEQMKQVVHFSSEVRIANLLQQAGFGTIVPFFQALLFRGWVAMRTG